MRRRKFLQLSAWGTSALALTVAGCAQNTAPTPTAVPPTAIPPTAIPPTIVPATLASATAPATNAPAAAPIPASPLANNIQQAAIHFLESLDNARRDMATFDFSDAERVRWHWTTPGNFPRNGLPLTEMTHEQKNAAFALLQASVSLQGFQKSRDIMSLQSSLGNNPELYFVTVFGSPDAKNAWG